MEKQLPLDALNRVWKAVVFDIDGTLYRQAPLRRAMFVRLLSAYAMRPVLGWRTITALRAYRGAQEQLRGNVRGDVAGAQLRFASERARMDPGFVSACVERWMEREPLTILPRYIQPGLVEFLENCRARGVRLAALSDYPGDAKLRALGIARLFDAAFCAQAPEIGAFKPNPRGLLFAIERLSASPDEVLYVGDRADVDATAAHAAGVACVILARNPAKPTASSTYSEMPSYADLHQALFRETAASVDVERT
jgi:FMN phosphatase YigB (HAD superfamily)